MDQNVVELFVVSFKKMVRPRVVFAEFSDSELVRKLCLILKMLENVGVSAFGRLGLSFPSVRYLEPQKHC